jgi:hypothetical protein
MNALSIRLEPLHVRTLTWFEDGNDTVAMTGELAAYSGVAATKRSFTWKVKVTV